MITIYCSYYPQKKSEAARKFLEGHGALFKKAVCSFLSPEDSRQTGDLITHVISGADQKFTHTNKGVEIYFGIHANPPLDARIEADQLYDEILQVLLGSEMSKIGIKIAYVSGIHGADRNEVVRIPR